MGIIDKFFSLFSPSKNSPITKEEEEQLLQKFNELYDQITKYLNEKQQSDKISPKSSVDEHQLASALIDFISLLKTPIESAPEPIKKSIKEQILKNLIYPEQLYQDFQNDPLKHIFKELFVKFHELDIDSASKIISKGAIYKQFIEPFINSIQDTISTSTRARLYKTIEQLYYSFPIARRIVREYTQSIIQEDLLGEDFLYLSPNNKIQKYFSTKWDEIKEEAERVVNLIRMYIDDRNLLKNKIIHEVAIKGDIYVEVIDKKEFLLANNFTIKYVPKKINGELPLSYSDGSFNPEDFVPQILLTETEERLNKTFNDEVFKFTTLSQKIVSNTNYLKNPSLISDVITEGIDLVSKSLIEVELPIGAPLKNSELQQETLINLSIIKDSELIAESENKEKDELETLSNQILANLKQIDYKKLKSRIELKIHKPEYVIPVSDNDKIYGYIVINPSLNDNQQGTTIKTILQKLGSVLDKLSVLKQEESEKLTKLIYTKLIDHIYTNIQSALTEYVRKLDSDSLTSQHPDEDSLQTYTARLKQIIDLLSQNEKIKEEFFLSLQDIIFEKTFSKLKVRFVFPENMVHFYFNIETFPYGESVLSPIMLHSTLYIISVYSNILYRLTRTPLYVKYQIDAGTMQNWKSYLNRLVNELRTKQLTVDDIGNLDRIRQYVTDFKFMFEITENGAPKIAQTMERLGDPSVRIQDIQDFKTDIINMSEIPSMRLGLMDGTELREKIVDANIQFAQKITIIQRNLGESLNKLISIIVNKITDYQMPIPISEIVRVKFHEPLSLKLLQIQNLITTASTIVSTIGQIPGAPQQIDLFKMLEKLIPSINWNEFKKQSTTTKQSELEDQLNTNQNTSSDETSGGMGGF